MYQDDLTFDQLLEIYVDLLAKQQVHNINNFVVVLANYCPHVLVHLDNNNNYAYN
jgi:hypothetical protein